MLVTWALPTATPLHVKNFPPKASAIKAEKTVPSEKPEQPAPQPAPAQALAVEAAATQTEIPAPAPAVEPTPSPQCVYGFTVSDYYENLVMQRESGGNSCVTNYLGCVGLFQACPGSKLYAACPTLDVDCQLNFFTGMMLSDPKYGSWAAVWRHELNYGWW